MIDRVPPQNIEAEQAVLGAMLLEREAIAKVMEKLRSEDFYREAHKVIFNAMLELYNRNEAVDLVTVTEVLKRTASWKTLAALPMSLRWPIPCRRPPMWFITPVLSKKNPFCASWCVLPRKLRNLATKAVKT